MQHSAEVDFLQLTEQVDADEHVRLIEDSLGERFEDTGDGQLDVNISHLCIIT